MEHDGTRWKKMEQDGTRWNKMEQMVALSRTARIKRPGLS
jgi:hypothetical protein